MAMHPIIAFEANYSNLGMTNSTVMEDTLIKELSKLNQSDKIDLLEALWDSITSEPNQVAVPDHHITILEDRFKTLDEDTAKGKPWSIIREKYV